VDVDLIGEIGGGETKGVVVSMGPEKSCVVVRAKKKNVTGARRGIALPVMTDGLERRGKSAK